MRRLAAPLLLLLAVAAVGCGPGRYIRRGDAHMRNRRHAEAERAYRRALEISPKLAQDPIFSGKLRRAHSLRAYDQGMRLANQGQWDEAIPCFAESRDADPDHAEAARALAWARAEGSKAHHGTALDHADHGRLDAAGAEVRRALVLDPGNAAARESLDSVSQKSTPALAAAQALFAQAQALAPQRQWGRAAAALEKALDANANHVLARVALCQARGEMGRATSACDEGRRLLAAKRLEEARDAFGKALAAWPFHPTAKPLLDKATALRQQAEDHYQRAVGLADGRQWPEAVAAAAKALALFPYHTQAQNLLAHGKERAATAHCARGRELLAKGQLDAAEAELARAFAYLPGFPDARAGLAEVCAARAAGAERDELWGTAILWYLEAADHADSPALQARAAAARAKARQRATFTVALDVPALPGLSPIDHASFRFRLYGQAERLKPATLAIVQHPAPMYRAIAELVGVAVHSGVARAEHRTQRYTIYQDVPNPELPALRRDAAAARHDLREMVRELHRPCPDCHGRRDVPCDECRGSGKRICRTCRGSGRRPCGQCGGKGGSTSLVACSRCKGRGRIRGAPCSHCGGKGKISRRVPCSRCKGSKSVPCPVCHGSGRRACRKCGGRGVLECSRCRGTGRGGRVSEHELRRQERIVRELEDRFRRAPSIVTQGLPAEWRYVVHHHVKTGTAEANIQTQHGPTRTVTHTDTITRTARHEDTTVDNANPEIGVDEDPLELPTDGSVRRVLVDEAAAEAASKLVHALVDARAKELKARAEDLARQGKSLAAIEAQIDYAHTIEATNPSGAATIFARLRKALRQGP